MADQKPVPGARWTRDGKELHCQDPACGWHRSLPDCGWDREKLVKSMRGHRAQCHPGVDEPAGDDTLTVLIQIRDLLTAIHQKIDKPPVVIVHADGKLTADQLDEFQRVLDARLKTGGMR